MSQITVKINYCNGCYNDDRQENVEMVLTENFSGYQIDLCRDCDEKGLFICRECASIHKHEQDCPAVAQMRLEISPA